MSNNPGERREGQLSRDRDTIREWAREHDATPIRETDKERDSGRFRMVPKDEMTETHEEVEWEEFFDQLDESDHVVIYHGEGDRGTFEVAGQSSVASRVDDEEIEQRLMEGETVTSTITETTVVESVVVEEITVDSELVDTQVADERVVDAELLRRECTDCDLVADETADTREWFATDRYLETVTGHTAGDSIGSPGPGGREGATEPSMDEIDQTETASMDATDQTETTSMDQTETASMDQTETASMDEIDQSETAAPDAAGTRGTATGPDTAGIPESDPESAAGSEPVARDRDVPFRAELEVEETWAVTRSFTEEFIVESRVTDTEITEADTIEDYDIEIEGLHRSIVESGVIKEDVSVDEAMTEYEIQSELAEQDRITTTFARERTVEDEIVDTSLATASVTEIQPLEMEVVRTKPLETQAAPSDTQATPSDTHEETEAGAALGSAEEESTHSTADEGTAAMVTITSDAIGEPVVNAKGERIGMVTEVEEEANALFIDPEPGLTGRIRAILGWGDVDDDDYRLEADAIRRITDDGVELKSPEELD